MQEKRFSLLIILLFFFYSCECLLAQNLKYKRHASGISHRDVLELGEPINRVSKFAPANVQTKQVPDTLRILAIRVDFQEDNNSLTTGNGKFELDPSTEAFIDPPPHDLTYFQHQLLALSNYYRRVSNLSLIHI